MIANGKSGTVFVCLCECVYLCVRVRARVCVCVCVGVIRAATNDYFGNRLIYRLFYLMIISHSKLKYRLKMLEFEFQMYFSNKCNHNT